MNSTSVSLDAALTVVPEANEIFGTLRFDISFVFESPKILTENPR